MDVVWAVKEVQHHPHQRWIQPCVDKALALVIRHSKAADQLVNAIGPAKQRRWDHYAQSAGMHAELAES